MDGTSFLGRMAAGNAAVKCKSLMPPISVCDHVRQKNDRVERDGGAASILRLLFCPFHDLTTDPIASKLSLENYSSGTAMPKVSKHPCRPDSLTITARLCFILSVQPRSKSRLASAAPTAPPVCGRRSVQSRQER